MEDLRFPKGRLYEDLLYRRSDAADKESGSRDKAKVLLSAQRGQYYGEGRTDRSCLILLTAIQRITRW